MTVEKIELNTLKNVLSHFDFDYYTLPQNFQNYINYLPEINSFRKAANTRENFAINRSVLHQFVIQSYNEASINIVPQVQQNIDSLIDSKTFTVTTAHQPCVLGGPMYFYLKIASLISLSQKINQKYSDEFNVVPVFVIGGEDHDFEEISSVKINGNELKWQHGNIGGPVGRMNHEGSFELLSELKEMLGHSETGLHLFHIFKNAYENTHNLGQATQHWVNEIFAEYGLVIVNFDNNSAKSLFTKIMQEEVQSSVSQTLVNEAQRQLDKDGYKAQAYAREINLYKLGENSRSRLLKLENNNIGLEGSNDIFTSDEIISDIQNNPENYSPNVVMRPLLQELVLPNLAYLGGGGELAYWMERKQQFNHFGVHYPILIRRDSLSWLDKSSIKKIKKLQIEIPALFNDRDTIIREYLSQKSKIPLEARLEKEMILENLEKICLKAEQIDPTVASALRAESTRISKQIDQMESRLLRAEKQKNEIAISQIDYLKDKLFPKGKLQERQESFISLYIQTQGKLTDILLANLDSLERKWNLLIESAD